MLNSIHIKGFKGFIDTKIDPVRKVNLILGGQNVGKTSLLEAVYLGASHANELNKLPSVFRRVEGHDAQRFMQTTLQEQKILIELFSEDGVKLSTCLNPARTKSTLGMFVSEYQAGGISVERYVDITSSADANFSLRSAEDFVQKLSFSNPLAVSIHLPDQIQAVQLFDKIVIARKKKKLLEMLRSIEPRLEDMHSLSPDGDQRIYIEMTGHTIALPLPLLGHGFSRLVYLYCSLLITQSKLVLIDEIENGIHYSSLPTLFQGIQEIAVKHDVQTIMTTHSWECIRAAYNIFAKAGRLQDFQLIRLEREADNVRAIAINDENLDSVMEAGYEVR